MSSLLSTLRGVPTTVPPVWLMRQAGRYLPEYRAVRAQVGSFLDLVYNPEQAAEVTVQPLRRFGFDAAIVFSDILVIPQILGVDVRFEAGEGPRLSPVRTTQDLEKLVDNPFPQQQVFDVVGAARHRMNQEGFGETPLIGFAGAPWTVACYMIQGHGKDHDFPDVIETARRDLAFFQGLLDRIVEATIPYLLGQVDQGAAVLQLFDSWAGIVPDDLWETAVINPTRRIVKAVRAQHTGLPVIGFPRGVGSRIVPYATQTGITAISLSQDIDLAQTKPLMPRGFSTQGNLDPEILLHGGSDLDRAVDRILAAATQTPHVFNLGHGILPATPIDHVQQLINRVRGKL